MCIGVLRTNLFGLYSCCVLSAEAQFCDGYIIQDDVEVFSTFKQLPTDQQRNLSTERSESSGRARNIYMK